MVCNWTRGGSLSISLTFIAFTAMSRGALAQDHFPPKPIEAFLSQHCYDCHDDSVSKGDLNLLDLSFKPDDHLNFSVWERVFERVDAGEMPPKKKPRPPQDKKAAFLKELKSPLVAADLADKKQTGRVQVRRLTRLEYEHTIHDLIGIDMPLQELLPEDPSTHGFETVATGQQLSHHNMGNYLEVADLVLDDAFKRAQAKEETKFTKFVAPEALSKKGGGNYRGPEFRKGESISYPMRLQFYGRVPQATVPEDGWYRVTLKNVRAVNPSKSGTVWGTLKSGECSSNAPMMYPIGIIEATAEKRDMVYEAWIRKGHMLELKPNDATLKSAPSGAKGGNVSYNGRDLVKQGFSGIANSGIYFERIYPNSTRWQLQQNLFPGITKEDAEALKKPGSRNAVLERTITNFANRAFRRPVTKEQIDPYVQLAIDTLKSPESPPRQALQAAYRAILCSPRFLTLIEPQGKLDDHAIASRLSYALWTTMPDKQLRKLADEGKLSDPKVFHGEVKRLIDDPKSEQFIASFTDQWLNLKEIEFTAPDMRLFKTFDGIVQESMVAETRAFFRDMLVSNRPITNIIDADFAYANERLARFYNMDRLPVKPGGGLQRVGLGDYKRGGIVTQGSILKVTANGTTTSPVVRGVFVSERLLGIKIPPPPANVPAVEPDIRGAVSIRDQLDKHKSSESCAGCHVNIDPAGFALETFDPVGLYRTKYGTKKNAAKVDPSGVTPDGVEFGGVSGWKDIYTKRPELLTKAFTKNLLTYATGAEPRFSDRDAIDAIVKAVGGEKEFKMRSIFHAALGSEIFKTK